MKYKYVTYGYGNTGPKMYVIIMDRTEHGFYRVEVLPCDVCGTPVSDAVAWNILPSWWDARKYFNKQYREFDRFVNCRV